MATSIIPVMGGVITPSVANTALATTPLTVNGPTSSSASPNTNTKTLTIDRNSVYVLIADTRQRQTPSSSTSSYVSSSSSLLIKSFAYSGGAWKFSTVAASGATGIAEVRWSLDDVLTITAKAAYGKYTVVKVYRVGKR